MKKDVIIMAMKFYVLEIMSNTAERAESGIVATGRSDFLNQLNNCMNFPGISKMLFVHVREK
jgi:malate dehydrogenase (oxaloacetate-decarboxylating)